jgi:acyl-CoA hydrolase
MLFKNLTNSSSSAILKVSLIKERKPMQITEYASYRLVKGEDLNHHGTLFAGRSAEWLVESGFVAAAAILPPANIVCLKIHGMTFKSPVQLGDIAILKSKLVHAGRTSLVAYIRIMVKEEEHVSGFITFIHVDQHGKSIPHGLTLEAATSDDQALMQQASLLK